MRGRCESEHLLGTNPWLNHHLCIINLSRSRDFQVIFDPRNHLSLRLHNLGELKWLRTGLAALLLELKIVLLYAEFAEILNLPVSFHVLHFRPATHSCSDSDRGGDEQWRREEENEEDNGGGF